MWSLLMSEGHTRHVFVVLTNAFLFKKLFFNFKITVFCLTMRRNGKVVLLLLFFHSFLKKVFWKYAANLPENTHAKVWLQ